MNATSYNPGDTSWVTSQSAEADGRGQRPGRAQSVASTSRPDADRNIDRTSDRMIPTGALDLGIANTINIDNSHNILKL